MQRSQNWSGARGVEGQDGGGVIVLVGAWIGRTVQLSSEKWCGKGNTRG